MVAPERVRSFSLLVPGPWPIADTLIEVLHTHGLDAGPPGQGPFHRDALELTAYPCERGATEFVLAGLAPSAAPELRAAIEAAPTHVVLELGWGLDEHLERTLALVRALEDAGGLCTSFTLSGATATWDQWRSLAVNTDSGEFDTHDATGPFVLAPYEEPFESRPVDTASGELSLAPPPLELMKLAVVFGLRDGCAFSCGMHHFDLPDAELRDVAGQGLSNDEILRWLFELCAYQLIEAPLLASGHTFAPAPEFERRALERWPDARHGADDGRYNPFGVWHLVESTPVRARDPMPVAVPSFVSVLSAVERQRGEALDQAQVRELVDGCPTLALSLAHARDMERRRGYADLVPELAWEQWQIERLRC